MSLQCCATCQVVLHEHLNLGKACCCPLCGLMSVSNKTISRIDIHGKSPHVTSAAVTYSRDMKFYIYLLTWPHMPLQCHRQSQGPWPGCGGSQWSGWWPGTRTHGRVYVRGFLDDICNHCTCVFELMLFIHEWNDLGWICLQSGETCIHDVSNSQILNLVALLHVIIG